MGTGTANSYTYDDNGNITFDPSIDADIAYNYLNLPDSIVFEDGKKFKYQYDFSGTLHRKIEFMNDTIKSYRDYLNGVEFYNSDIDFIHHNNGYIQNGSTCVSDSILTLIGNETINKTYLASEIISNKIVNPADSIDYLAQDTICLIPGFEVPLGNTYLAEIEEYDCDTISPQWEYIFGIKDHLANTRLAFGDLNKNEEIEPDEIISRHDYYPFGLEIDGEWKQQNHYAYRYNGKEKQEFGWYNYGARFYDPTVGRFPSLDRFSEDFSFQSPYAYAQNNPIRFIDINGDSTGVPLMSPREVAKGIGEAVSIAWTNMFGEEYSQKDGVMFTMTNGQGNGQASKNQAEEGPNIDDVVALAGVTKTNFVKKGSLAAAVESESKLLNGMGKAATATDKMSKSVKKTKTVIEGGSSIIDDIKNATGPTDQDSLIKTEYKQGGTMEVKTFIPKKEIKP